MGDTYILDLLYGKVGICRHANLFWLYVDNDEYGVGGIALK